MAINYKAKLHFAKLMLIRYTQLLKEWQHYALVKLNEYCEGKIECEDYVAFIKGYQKTYLRHQYWVAEVSWCQFNINTEVKNGESNNTDRQN